MNYQEVEKLIITMKEKVEDSHVQAADRRILLKV